MRHAIYSYFHLVFILIFLVLAGCGIRPSNVILPDDGSTKQPANVYPNPDKNIP